FTRNSACSSAFWQLRYNAMPRSNDLSESSRLSSPCSMRDTSCSSSSSDFSKSAIWDVSAVGGMARTLAQRSGKINRRGDAGGPVESGVCAREEFRASLADPEVGDG